MNNFVKTVKAANATNLEERINAILKQYHEATLVDIKVTGAGNGNDNYFIAVIIFKN